MDTKSVRQKILRNCIEENRCEDQQALVQLLHSKGVITTQAVVSRDLKEMGVIKKSDELGRYYAIPIKDLEKEILERAVLNVSHNKAIIIVHTIGGMAAFVGDMLDSSELPLLGCISGENVVFVAPADVDEIENVCLALEDFLCIKK